MIQDAADFIQEIEGVDLDPRAIPDDDPGTYAMLQRGDAYGVFQFEAPQVKRMLIEGRPENLIDLAAINAANRPGPIQSGNTELYLQNRKRGQAGHSQYPLVADILDPTGGVLLFQEQVLEIARKLAGFTLGEADVLRKAMGKKKQELMEEQRKQFLERAAARGLDSRQVREIWDMMEKFAGYGFNKSHSTCYAWIAFQTAYLKCHYPQYFMAAMLNSFLGNSAKLAQILAQCRQMRITVHAPSVNASGYDFRPTKEGAIYYGLGGVKGIGAGPVDAIVAERQAGGAFQSLAGFYQRMRGKGLNKKVLQSLAMAGAFDCLHADRAELIQNLDDIEGFLRGPDNQISLFGDDSAGSSSMLPSKEVSLLDVAFLEKEAIGLFLTYHPFADHVMYRDQRYLQLAAFEESVLSGYAAWTDRVLPGGGLAGLLSGVQVRHANTSSRLYAKARLEDPERSIGVVIWPKAYENARDFIAENTPVILFGRVQIPETVQEPEQAWDELEVVVDRILPYNADGARLADSLPFGAGEGALPEQGLARLSMLMEEEAPAGAGSEPDRETVGWNAPEHGATEFNPAPLAPSILFDIDLQHADLAQLTLLAQRLEHVQGEREVRLRLRDVSQQLVQIKVNRRFYINDDVVAQLEREFPFLRNAG
jgi:DNA polymerase III subunit alpha